MSPWRRLVLTVVGIALLTGAGAAGYVMIEDMSWIDALYMSVITISTVGFGEVKPLSADGRIFTMGLILFGVGTAFYLLTVAAELVVEGRLREYLGKTAMTHKIHQLRGHIILCGYGRFGRVVGEELLKNSAPLAVIDSDPGLEPELVRLGLLYLIGSATDDDVLERAAIRHARAIVVGTASDADNVYIALSAREKNPSISIHARAESEAGARRLKLAGANQVVSVYQSGGIRMATRIIRPSVVDFLELSISGRGGDVSFEEIKIEAKSQLVGRALRTIEQDHARLRIIGLKRGGSPISILPSLDITAEAGDYLLTIGDRDSLKQLVKPVKQE